MKHPIFLSNEYTTKFIDTTPDLFDFDKRRDRGTKVLTYIADVSVNGHPETKDRPLPNFDAPTPISPNSVGEMSYGTRNLLEQKGAKAVADWVLKQRQLLLTDTTMRDGHQSLLATRMRSVDMIRVAPAYASNLPSLFPLNAGAVQPLMLLTDSFRMPMAAFARFEGPNAKPDDANVATCVKRRWLYKLSR